MNLAPHYIAFSIHGTNAFIVATNTTPPVGDSFQPVVSRLNTPSGQKWSWSELVNKKTGKPYTSTSMVLARFNQLRRMGWEVDDTAFRKRFNFKPSK